MYNYLETVKEDVKEYIAENIDISEFGDIEELKEKLNEDLWINDSVTGNASGSYTCNRAKAKKYVDDNKELIIEMAEEFRSFLITCVYTTQLLENQAIELLDEFINKDSLSLDKYKL